MLKYTLSISEKRTYVRVRVHEPLTMELVLEILSDTSASARVEGIKGLLFDAREVVSLLGPMASYEIAYTRLEQLGFPRNCLWAILVAPNDDSHDFMETVARNAGYRCRLFSDEQETMAWLEKDRERKTTLTARQSSG